MWIDPKTDWVANDYFNATDYNRIKNNIIYLFNYVSTLYNIDNIPDLGADKTYNDLFYADDMNAIETSLEQLNKLTFNFIYNSKVWQVNQKTPTFADFNRIESLILLIYTSVNSQKVTMPRLAFILGRQKGFK